MARWLMLAFILTVLGDASLAAGAEPRVPRKWRFTLPVGTASAGEQVFVKMERYVAADGTSRMGDYNELLTVRDLIDLVEFLEAIR